METWLKMYQLINKKQQIVWVFYSKNQPHNDNLGFDTKITTRGIITKKVLKDKIREKAIFIGRKKKQGRTRKAMSDVL